MGLTFTSLYNFWKGSKINILMLGLDNAGKTTILYKLRYGEMISSSPYAGLNVEVIESTTVKFTVWDVGGSEKFRDIWREFYKNASGFIFVIDSTDIERIDEARVELMRMLKEESLNNIPLLVLANKQDMQGAMNITEITMKLELKNLKGEWFIQSTCAYTGEGLSEGLDWFSKAIKQKK